MTTASASEGHRLFERGALTQAALAFALSLELAPDDADCLLGLVRVRIAQGDLTEAEDVLHRLFAVRSGDVEGLSHLALLQATLGEEGAVERLKKLAAAPGAGYFERLNLGLALTERDDVEGALAAYAGALEARPDSRPAHLALGKLALHCGEYDAAIEHLGAAAHATPGEAVPLLLLSRAHAGRGEGGLALQLARKAASHSPHLGELHEELLGLALRADDSGTAVREARELRALDPESPRYTFLHGLALLAAGRPEAAATFEETQRQAPPGEVQTWAALARRYVRPEVAEQADRLLGWRG